jgi:fibronectin type 3 domain-containing protein
MVVEKPVQVRFIKLENTYAHRKFAINGLRVLVMAMEKASKKKTIVLRTEKDKRSAFIKWKPANDAFAYNIYYGTHPNKLYTCIMVHNNNEYWMKAMDLKKDYYYTIEAVNENGTSERIPVQRVE